jgi:hypothetical protein
MVWMSAALRDSMPWCRLTMPCCAARLEGVPSAFEFLRCHRLPRRRRRLVGGARVVLLVPVLDRRGRVLHGADGAADRLDRRLVAEVARGPG